MSLINQMLKDLEARRSRDLETSESLNNDISWESTPKRKGFSWLTFFVVLILLILLSVVGYLLWERLAEKDVELVAARQQAFLLERKKADKAAAMKLAQAKIQIEKKLRSEAKVQAAANARLAAKIRKEEKVRAEAKALAEEKVRANRRAQLSAKNNIIVKKSVEEVDTSPQIDLKKRKRPLNNKQLAEIAYQKGYKLLQQGRMHSGRKLLRDALSFYLPHIRAREMLAGIYIKSGRLINAAELLSEGVKIAPEYPLFAQLYARVLLEQNKAQLAVRVLEQGARVTAVEPDYHALLAASYQRINNHQKSVEIYLRLVKIRPNEGVWWLGLAISLEKTGKNKSALEAYQRAQQTGSLKSGLVKFTNNRVSALKEIGFPEAK